MHSFLLGFLAFLQGFAHQCLVTTRQPGSEVKVRMQRTKRLNDVVETTLGETIGSESAVLVMVDPAEMPRNWKSVELLAEKIGEEEYRVIAEERHADGTVDADQVLLSATDAVSLQTSAARLGRVAKVTLGDMHLDAKLFPDKHPYGSGSLRSLEGSCKMQTFAKNRSLLLESVFRKSPVWAFWMLERLIKNDLYFREQSRQRRCAEASNTNNSAKGCKRAAPDQDTEATGDARVDPYEKLFTRIDPRHIPESGSWWKARQSNLMSISDDHEYGLMTSMVPSTQVTAFRSNAQESENVPLSILQRCQRFSRGKALLSQSVFGQQSPIIAERIPAAISYHRQRFSCGEEHFIPRSFPTTISRTCHRYCGNLIGKKNGV